MKHHNPDIHLSDDELLRAMVDPSDLGPTRQAHLNACPHCRRQSQDLTEHYNRLGQMAREMAPAPQKHFRLPAHTGPVRHWHFKPVMALGMLGALIFVLTLWGPHITHIFRTSTPMVAHNGEHDGRLLEEVDTLVEDALPEEYQQVATLSGDRSVEDLDDFMDWMVPAPYEKDDSGQPAASGRPSRQGPVARWDATATAGEGTMA